MDSDSIHIRSISPSKVSLRTLGRSPTLSSAFSGEPSISGRPTMVAVHQPPFSFPFIEDCIGNESCAHLMPLLEWSKGAADDEAVPVERSMMTRRTPRWETKERRKEKEYPPLIPLLARTENLHSHMPWILKRTYTGDGRLILREVRVRHHEYFKAHRQDGRLTLQLVPLDDEIFDLEDDAEAGAEAVGDGASLSVGSNDYGDDQLHSFEAGAGNMDDTCDHDELEYTTERIGQLAAEDGEPILAAPLEMGGGLGKCLKACNIGGVNVNGASSCIFGVAVPALGPVH